MLYCLIFTKKLNNISMITRSDPNLLTGNYGSHSLRKTWGYHQRKRFCVDIPTLMVMYNHSSQKQTLDYLRIQPQEIKDVYLSEL